jgi:hypothetical protein
MEIKQPLVFRFFKSWLKEPTSGFLERTGSFKEGYLTGSQICFAESDKTHQSKLPSLQFTVKFHICKALLVVS